MIPPWEIPDRLAVPQYYGLFAGERHEGLSLGESIDVVNRARERQGLPPLTDELPDCCRPAGGWAPTEG